MIRDPILGKRRMMNAFIPSEVAETECTIEWGKGETI